MELADSQPSFVYYVQTIKSNNYIHKQFPNDLRGSACLYFEAYEFGLSKQLKELLHLAEGTQKMAHGLFRPSFLVPPSLSGQGPPGP